MTDKGIPSRRGLVAAALVIATACGGAARADQLLASSPLVYGSLASATSFNVSGPGTVTVSLTDLGFTDPLASLSFFAETPTGLVAQSSLSGPGTISFNVGSPGLYSAVVSAVANTNAPLDLGQYSMKVDFAPTTPLPPGLWLFLSGLGGLAVAIRGRKPLLGLPAAA